MKKGKFFRLAAAFMSLSFLSAMNYAVASGGEVKRSGGVTILTVSSNNLQPQMASASISFSDARAMQMPEPPHMVPDTLEVSRETKSRKVFKGAPGFVSGQAGNGKRKPMSIPKLNAIDVNDSISTQEFGTSQHPFTTSRADTKVGQVSKEYPFSASGKLFFNIGTSSYVCSASLIKKGIIVTAAHCVAGYGTGEFHSNWVYVPAQNDRFTPNAPYGVYSVTDAVVMSSWIDGTDGCDVICPNDVAVLVAAPIEGVYPGTRTGFLSYGWDNYGFTSFVGLNAAVITQLGYPVGLENGGAMQRTDSLGYTITTAGWFNNIQIGSRMRGGSSGGPWIINFGIDSSATPDLPGSSAQKNTIVAVTSWGRTSTDPMVQGASPFTSNNIVPLVNTVCPSEAC